MENENGMDTSRILCGIDNLHLGGHLCRGAGLERPRPDLLAGPGRITSAIALRLHAMTREGRVRYVESPSLFTEAIRVDLA